MGLPVGPDYHRQLIAIGRTNGLAAVGIAPAEPFATTLAELRRRAVLGLHDGMSFTYRNPQRSTDAAATLAEVKSLVVGALAYPAPVSAPAEANGGSEGPSGENGSPVVAGRVAAYAQEDFYGALRRGLEIIADRLRIDGHRSIVVADQNALVDREAAVRAGLGWYGKSSNVLVPRAGSYFVLGSVLTTAALTPSAPVADGCGSCRRCLDGCPTGAIIEPGVIDAGRCLAWLVQKTGPFERRYRRALGDRLYGCDDCQEVCPPNRRSVSVSLVPGSAAHDAGSVGGGVDVLALLEASDSEILERHGRWYIPERDPRWVRRNALVVLGNHGDSDGDGSGDGDGDGDGDGAPVTTESRRSAPLPEGVRARADAILVRYLHGEDPILRAQALWSARRLGRSELGAHLATDDDAVVAEEWSHGLLR